MSAGCERLFVVGLNLFRMRICISSQTEAVVFHHQRVNTQVDKPAQTHQSV